VPPCLSLRAPSRLSDIGQVAAPCMRSFSDHGKNVVLLLLVSFFSFNDAAYMVILQMVCKIIFTLAK